MNSYPQYLLLITGVPASGKTFLSEQLNSKLTSLSINHKILSTDNLEAFLNHHQDLQIQNIRLFFAGHLWHLQLPKYKLNKQNFCEKTWNLSRKTVENFDMLDLLFSNCQILIIEDELPLKSQRKPFKKYCSQKNIKFLEIQIHVTLEEAIQNNQKRGQQNVTQKVSNQVITKSLEKFESNQNCLILTKQTIPDFLNQEDILSNFKIVEIHDNYTEYLSKKNLVHEYAEKEMDQNQIRKMIAKIMKDEVVASEYCLAGLYSKEKAQILAECKKIYIQQKRKVAFKQIVENYMSKTKQKEPDKGETHNLDLKPQKQSKFSKAQNTE